MSASSLIALALLIVTAAFLVRSLLRVQRRRRQSEWVREPISLALEPTSRTVLVTGATSFIGGHLVRHLLARGDAVIVLTRDADRARDCFGPHVRIVTSLKTIESTERIDAIVNLAGAAIFAARWTPWRRHILRTSRIDTTRAVVALCASLQQAPGVLVSASAVGYYGVHEHEVIDEQSEPQAIFQSQLCREWEEAALEAERAGVRVVRLRMGVVLARDGGALPGLAWSMRRGLGAILGSGKQFVSWIHIDDVISLIELAVETRTIRGAINAVGPQPASHEQFQKALAQTIERPLRLRVPAWLLRLALGERAQLLVDGQRVFPKRALVAGFEFRHPHLREALFDLLHPAPRPAPRDAGARGGADIVGG